MRVHAVGVADAAECGLPFESRCVWVDPCCVVTPDMLRVMHGRMTFPSVSAITDRWVIGLYDVPVRLGDRHDVGQPPHMKYPLVAILRHHNIGYHIYADDTQLYISFKCKDPLESLTKLNMCI